MHETEKGRCCLKEAVHELSSEEVNAYEKVYEITASYMKKSGDKPLFSLKVFMLGIGHPSDYVDMKNWDQMDNRDYTVACYLYLLGRMPTEDETTDWSNVAGKKSKLILTNTIMNSEEFKMRKIIIANCPYSTKLRKTLWKRRIVDSLAKTRIYRCYEQLDEEKKRKIRSITH